MFNEIQVFILVNNFDLIEYGYNWKPPSRKERRSTDYHSSIIKTLIFMMQRAKVYERVLHVRTYFSSLHQPDMNQTLDLCK